MMQQHGVNTRGVSEVYSVVVEDGPVEFEILSEDEIKPFSRKYR
jgi:hypothetical protein